MASSVEGPLKELSLEILQPAPLRPPPEPGPTPAGMPAGMNVGPPTLRSRAAPAPCRELAFHPTPNGDTHEIEETSE
jgi:hypothetical protein